MLKHFKLFALLFSIFMACKSDEKKPVPVEQFRRIEKDTFISHVSDKFLDIDTTIFLKLFNLTAFGKKIPKSKKIDIITKAVKSAMPNAQDRYLEALCTVINPKTKEIDRHKIKKAPDCRLKDFHLIDLDADGDLDLVYSSIIDQYVQTETNSLLLLRNTNGSYERFSIGGYAYYADFSNRKNGIIIFKTASRPCCDYPNYNLYTTVFNTNTWTFDTKHEIEIHSSKVKEQL